MEIPDPHMSEANLVKKDQLKTSEYNLEEKKEIILNNMEKKTDNCAVVDAVFMCDCTSSMSPYLDGSKEIIKQMIKDIKEKYRNSSIFVGFIAYRDHCDKTILETLDLTSDFEVINTFISSLKASGGGDPPEAVADGLNFAANKINWREEQSLRMLIHILDAPPHGKEFGGKGDSYPNGCPCKLDYANLIQKLASMKIQYLVLKVNNSVDLMIQIFKKLHNDFYLMDISSQINPHRPTSAFYSIKSSVYPFKPKMRTLCAEKKGINDKMSKISNKKEALCIPTKASYSSMPNAYQKTVNSQILSNVMKKFG